jgi:hypothetical protein
VGEAGCERFGRNPSFSAVFSSMSLAMSRYSTLLIRLNVPNLKLPLGFCRILPQIDHLPQRLTWRISSMSIYGPTYQFLVSILQEKRSIIWTGLMEKHHPGGGWVDIVRQSIAIAFGIPRCVPLTITFIDKNDKEIPLYVVLHFRKPIEY